MLRVMLPGNTNVIDVCQIHEEKERERTRAKDKWFPGHYPAK